MLRKPPCIRQHDRTDCGPAVLATIAKTHGLRLTVGRIRELASTDRDGNDLRALKQAAEQLGFSAKGVQGEFDHLTTVPLPAVAHVRIEDREHYVVVHRATNDRVLVADPAVGLEWKTRGEFESIWTGVLLLLQPTPELRDVEPSAKTRDRFVQLMKPHRSVLLEAFVCAVAATILGLGVSFYIKFLVDSVFVRGEAASLHMIGFGMILLFLFRGVFGALRQYLLIHLSRKIDVTLILKYYNHVLDLPVRFFKTRRIGEILSRLGDVDKIRSLVSGTSLGILLDATMVLFASVVMFVYDIRLALVAFAGVPLLIAIIWLLHRPIRKVQRKIMEQGADLEANLVESVAGVETLKSYCAEDLARRKTEASFIPMTHSIFQGGMIGTGADIAAQTIAAFGSLAVLWYGSSLVLGREMSIGELMFFNSLIGFLFGPAERLTSVNQEIQDAWIAMERLGEILDIPTEDRKRTGSLSREIRGDLQFDKVSFQYGARERVLHGIDLSIPAGTTVALVGESGSGKTTLANLVPRFYDPVEGTIRIDGVDLRDFDLRALRSEIGYVSQDPFLFTGTISENIALGRPRASREEIVDAAKKANIHDFIKSLPGGYETVLREFGSSLSGGQKQRIAIARALLLDPKILILDEATSNLDSESESMIQRMLQVYRKKRTTLIIAHRLSTVAMAEQIVVLTEGRIVETGSHKDLIAKKGKYHALWMRQIPSDLRSGIETAPPRMPERGRVE